MKTIWRILSVLAIANVVAMAGLLAWLGTSDRLNRERVRQVREVFRQTTAAERQRAAEAKSAAEADGKTKAEEARMAVPPESAAAKIRKQEEADQVHLQRVLKREQEQRELRESLDRDRSKLDDERRAIAAERKLFEDYRKRLADTEGSEQFKKALDTLQGQKAKDAKEVLQAMIRDNKIEQVVSYLSAMEDRVRSRVIAEFVKEDRTVAADLLERLRTRGVAVPAVTEVASK